MTTDECHAAIPSLKHKRSRSKSLVRARKRRIHQQRHHPTCSPHTSYPARPPRSPSLFETYITSQSFLPPHEHHAFFTTLRRPLPLCFRIRSTPTLHEWHSLLHTLPPHDATTTIQRLPLHAPHTYQLPSHLPDLYPKLLRHWISSRTRGGQISRQEYVSMIPVHLLSIQSHHRVLDLCASPGSKTIQALDALYDSHHTSRARARGGGGDEEEETTVPLGFVMANELDVRRAYVLAHRTRETLKERMVSMAVVTHNACRFPNVLAPCRREHGLHPQQQQQQQHVNGGINSSPSSPKPFDRIICDVPCSGDGTLRKDTKIYKTWHPSYGMALHSLQLRIAKRGIALLHVGGYMTYSTCSFHPVENEAVVAALLSTGCVQLVHGTELVGHEGLEGVRYREGLSSWKVLNDECTILQRDGEEGKEWPDTLWPPRDEGIAQALKRCIRMVPQDNDTGGFFIALLKKVKDFDDCSKNGRSRKDVMVTPQMPFHRLYECWNVESPSQEKCRYFVRSQGGSTSISKAKTFKLSQGLADYLCDQQGSSKLNLVYAGHALTQPTDPDKK